MIIIESTPVSTGQSAPDAYVIMQLIIHTAMEQQQPPAKHPLIWFKEFSPLEYKNPSQASTVLPSS